MHLKRRCTKLLEYIFLNYNIICFKGETEEGYNLTSHGDETYKLIWKLINVKDEIQIP